MIRINQENINTNEAMSKEFKESTWFHELDYTDIYRYERFLSKFKGGKLLDLGCWNTPTALEAKKRFPKAEVYCVDIAESVVVHLKEKYPQINYQVFNCNKPIPFADSYFDYVVAGEIIEHLEDPEKFINEVMRVLKPGGYFAFSVPDSEMFKQKSVGGKWHMWSFDRDDFKKMLKGKGKLKIEEEIQGKVITLIGLFRKK